MERDTTRWSDWAHRQRDTRLTPIWLAIFACAMAGLLIFAGTSVGVRFLLSQPALWPGALTASEQLDVVRIALLTTGGAGALVALVVAYRKQRVAERTDAREEIALRQSNYQLFNELFTSVSTLLGSEAPSVRLAGVYGMAELADGWPRYQQVCVHVLCAYLRIPLSVNPEEHAAEQVVRSSVVTVIRDHLNAGAWSDCQLQLENSMLGNDSVMDLIGVRRSSDVAATAGGVQQQSTATPATEDDRSCPRPPS